MPDILTVSQAIEQWLADEELAHEIITGPAAGAGSTVDVSGNGTVIVPTMAKVNADAAAAFATTNENAGAAFDAQRAAFQTEHDADQEAFDGLIGATGAATGIWTRPVLAFITAAALAALGPAVGDRYVLTDGAYAREVAEYSGAETGWIYSGVPLPQQDIQNRSDGLRYVYSVADGWSATSASQIAFKTGSQIRTVGERLGNYPDVRDYGYAAANTDAQNATALDAYIAANQYLALPPDTIGYTGTLSLGAGQHLVGFATKLAQTAGNDVPNIDVNGDDVVVRGIDFTGYGKGIRIGASASTGAKIKRTRISDVRFLPTVATALDNCLWIYFVDGLDVDGLTCVSTGYGVLQAGSKDCANINLRRLSGEDMYSDLVEMNGAGALCDGLSIDNVEYKGAHDWTTANTERRVIGLTSVRDALMTNIRFKNAAGDSAFHLEDVNGRCVLDDLVGSDCNVSGGNDGVVYILNSAKHLSLSNVVYRKLTPAVGATCLIGTSSGNYSSELNVDNVQLFDDAGADELQAFNFGGHVGRSFISNVQIVGGSQFCELGGAAAKSFVNCGSFNTLNGIMANAGSTGNGGTDIRFIGGRFNVRRWTLNVDYNTGLSGNPTRWTLDGVKFDWAGTDTHKGVLLSHGVDCREVGTYYGAGFDNTSGGNYRKSCYLEGTGWLADV